MLSMRMRLDKRLFPDPTLLTFRGYNHSAPDIALNLCSIAPDVANKLRLRGTL
jgi:hypothetical protein